MELSRTYCSHAEICSPLPPRISCLYRSFILSPSLTLCTLPSLPVAIVFCPSVFNNWIIFSHSFTLSPSCVGPGGRRGRLTMAPYSLSADWASCCCCWVHQGLIKAPAPSVMKRNLKDVEAMQKPAIRPVFRLVDSCQGGARVSAIDDQSG